MRTAGEVVASDGDLIVEVIKKVSKSRTAQYIDLSKADASRAYDHVIIQGETIKAARLWLQTSHSTPGLDSWVLQEFDITDVFYVIKFRQIYLKTRKKGAELNNGENQLRPAKDVTMLREWFQAWYDYRVPSDHAHRSMRTQELLRTPAYWFDCVVIFRDVTKGVAVTDIQGIPGPVLGGMYSARSNLRTQTYRELYRSPRSHINCDDRKCRDVMAYRYFVALDATGSFPVNYGENRHKSVDRLLGDAENISLEIIELNPNTRHASRICNPCRQGNATQTAETLRGQVRAGISGVRNNSEGLCIDCMHKYKTGDKDCDYWNHACTRNFSKGCRFHHGEPTWHYSYMGRDDEMKKLKTATPTPGER
ncbi:hypothetical protein DL770_006863 [Monosporascus sp. CRB-9-2]|nr:hypothetical protein DL770_006863 [Monosporascus sp. CRB-9-2]